MPDKKEELYSGLRGVPPMHPFPKPGDKITIAALEEAIGQHGSRNLQLNPDGSCDLYANIVAAIILRAEQACRYMLKHNEDRWSREERSEDYAQGFKIACELCAEAIRPHVERHLMEDVPR